jgi:signal transduction histidine kinase
MGGSGLGLSIVKDAVTKLGGTIGATPRGRAERVLRRFSLYAALERRKQARTEEGGA